jgi:hypothetical protein
MPIAAKYIPHMSAVEKVKIHVLVRRCEHTRKWVAQGLEHDIVAQADTLKMLEKRFIATVLGYIHAYNTFADPLKEVAKAPKTYWDTYKKLQEKDRYSKVSPFPKRGKTMGEAVFLQAA